MRNEDWHIHMCLTSKAPARHSELTRVCTERESNGGSETGVRDEAVLPQDPKTSYQPARRQMETSVRLLFSALANNQHHAVANEWPIWLKNL